MGLALAVILLVAGAYAVWPRPRVPRSRVALVGPVDRVESIAGALEAIALCLQAGLTPVQAVDVALDQQRRARVEAASGDDAAMGAILADVRRALRRGAPGGPVWARHTAQYPELRVVAGAWTLTEASGSALHPALMWAVGQLREQRAARERLAAVTAGATSSMALMLVLPLSGMPVGLLVGVSPVELYGSWPAGLACAIGLGLAGAGMVLSRRLLRRALQPRRIAGAPGLPDATVDELADAALMLHLALSSGAGILQSLEQVADVSAPRIRAELRRVAAGYRWGLGHERSWAYAAPDWAPVASALALSLEHGAAPAASVQAAGLRLAAAERSRLAAAAGQAETFLLVPLAVLFLPSFALTTVIPLVIALVPRDLGF